MASGEDLTVLSIVYDFLKEKCSDAAKMIKKKTGVVSMLSVTVVNIIGFPEMQSD